ALEPAKPTIRDALQCAVQAEATDPDGDAVKLAFRWYRNGELLPLGPAQQKIPAGVARRGEKWACEVEASDGELKIAPVRRELTVENLPPTAPVAEIEPVQPRAGDDLVCVVKQPAADEDADALRYTFRWTGDDKPLTPGKDPARLPASLLRKGVRYRCEVSASDGVVAGPPGVAERAILNSPPARPVVRILPENPAAATTLTCELAEPATDADGDPLTYKFRWKKNGVEQTFHESAAQIPARLVKPEEVWQCVVIATDGASESLSAESGEALIRAADAAP
ncbi:MAG: hypothetical protein ACK4N5_20730, partial [Myxococcales bacterium]